MPFDAWYHLYPDSDEKFLLQWREAREDVPFLRGPQAINNLKWEEDRDDTMVTAVGEIWGTRTEFRYRKPNLLATGGHTCGTEEDFAGDGSIDWDSPPVEYRPDGLPLCCDAPPIVAGGLVLDGSATVYTTGPRVGYGGGVIGGTAIPIQMRTGRGGGSLGGSAIVTSGDTRVGMGGGVLGGTHVPVVIRAGRGGAVLGGTCYAALLRPCFSVDNQCGVGAPSDWIGVWCGYTKKFGESWYKWDVVDTTTYELNVSIVTPTPGIKWEWWHGEECGSKVKIAEGDSADGGAVFDWTAGGPHLWLRCYNYAAPPIGITFRVLPLHGP